MASVAGNRISSDAAPWGINRRAAGMLAFIFAVLWSAWLPGFADEQSAANTEKLLAVLVRNPRFGTTFDRVYVWHADRGLVAEFRRRLLNHAASDNAGSTNTAAGLPSPGSPADESLKIPGSCVPESALMLAAMLDLRHSEAGSAGMLLEQVLQTRPQDTIAHWYLGRARFLQDQPDQACKAFEQAIALKPARTDLLEIYREYASGLQRVRRPEDSLAVWVRLEKQFPTDRRVREQIAAAMAQDGRWQEAFTRYQQLASLASDPEQRIPMQLQASEMLLQMNQSATAIDLLASLIPEVDPEGWLYRDIRQRIEGIFRDARDLPGLARHYEQWLQDHPDDVDVMSRLGSALAVTGRQQEAEDWLRKAVTAAPGIVRGREALIEQLVRNLRIADAIQQYEQMSASDGLSDDHLIAWGLLYLNRKDLSAEQQRSGAADVWQRLLEKTPNDPAMLSRVAELMTRAGLFDRAQALYQKAMDAAPDQLQYREYLGEFLFRQRRPAEALAVWQGLVEGQRNRRENLVRLAEILRGAGLFEDAVTTMRKACNLEPELADRLAFAELLQEAAGLTENGPENGQPTEPRRNELSTTASGLIDEALSQLDLAHAAATTPEQRSQVLHQRVRQLLACGRLDAEILQLQQAVSGQSQPSVDQLQRLAACLDAAGRLTEAVSVCQQLTARDGKSISAWLQLMQLYERSARYGDAADVLRRLTTMDNRGQTEYLRRLARLEVRMGRYDRAMDVAKEVTESAPGATESWQFFAEIAFEAGKPEAAVDALRRAVRINPGDESSLRSLAKTLADEFRTAESIELYWRAFEQSPDADSRETLLVQLTHLALRSQSLPALLERLQQKARETRESTETAREMATVYRESGDFRKARGVLETVLAEDPENTSLLAELVALAEREKNAEVATACQLRIIRKTRNPEDIRRLLALEDADVRQFSPGDLIKDSLSSRPLRADVHAAIRIATSLQLLDVAQELCQRQTVGDPEDWWSLCQLARIDAQLGRNAAAAEHATQLLQMTLNADTTPVSVRVENGVQRTPATPASLSLWKRVPPEDPATFGEACAQCLQILENSAGAAAIRPLLESNFPEQSGWGPIALLVESTAKNTVARREFLSTLDAALAARSDMVATAIRLQILCSFLRLSPAALPAADRTVTESDALKITNQLLQNEPDWLLSYCQFSPAILRTRARHDYRQMLEQVIAAPDAALSTLSFSLQQSVQLQDAALLRQVLKHATLQSLQENEAVQIRTVLEQTNRDLLMQLLQTREDLTSLMSLLLRCRAVQQQPLTPRLLAVPQPGAITFRHQTAAADSSEQLISKVVSRAILLCEGTIGEVQTQLKLNELEATEFEKRILQAEILRQRGELLPLLYEMIAAAELQPEATDLRLWIAEQIVPLGLIDESLAIAGGLPTADPRVVIDGEMMALNISLANDRTERARAAAIRLSGLPLSQQQQLSLVPVLSRLGLAQEAGAMEARLGRGTETRTTVLGRQLQNWINSSKSDLAAEAAWELLKLSSGGNLFSGYRPNEDRDDGGERLLAIKALGRLGRIQPLIDRYEAMLAVSPNSLALLEILAEFHEAAEQWEPLAQKRDRIAVLSNRVPPGLKKQAATLESDGKVSAACDLYLQILKEDPAAFEQEIETFYQAFERADRRADFLVSVMQANESCWRDHSRLIINVIADVAASGKHPDAVTSSLSMLLGQNETRRTAIASVMARPQIATEESLLPAIGEELTQLRTLSDANPAERRVVTGEVLQILGGLRSPENCRQLEKQLPDDPTEGLEIPVARLYLQLVRNDITAVEQSLERLINRLQETQSAGDDQASAAHAAALFLLQERIEDRGPAWLSVRLRLLELLHSLNTQDRDLDLQVSIALGTLYEQQGRAVDAQALLLTRIQAARPQNLSANGPDAIRRLLQGAEQIQHSGYPVEASGLLLSVTNHDVDRFTRDLGEDKAIAFRSRWNASRRWGQQQIRAEQLVSWLERNLEHAAKPQDEAKQSPELLLELSGTTDPGCIEEDALLSIRPESLLFQAIEQADFSDASLRDRLQLAVTKIADTADVSAALLCVGILVNQKVAVTPGFAALPPGLAQKLSQSRSTNDGTINADQARGIPQSLRDCPEIAELLLTRALLARSAMPAEIVERLLTDGLKSAASTGNRLVSLAIVNECLAIATKAGLTHRVPDIQTLQKRLIQQQTQQSASASTATLAQEIALRLLQKSRP